MIKDTAKGQTQSYPQVDHEAALQTAKSTLPYQHCHGNLAACYRDLTAKHNQLRELSTEFHDAWRRCDDNDEIAAANKLRDFLKEG